jgi:protein tyrosine/serine phosphatase
MQVGSRRYEAYGGIHRIPTPGAAGHLHACGLSVVGPDPCAALDDVGAAILVCLLQPDEIERRFPAFAAWLTEPAPFRAIHLPTTDQSVADDDLVVELVGEVAERLRAGDGIVMHCGAGMGRTGVIGALVVVALGQPVDDALALVRAARPGAGPETGDQLDQVVRLAPIVG